MPGSPKQLQEKIKIFLNRDSKVVAQRMCSIFFNVLLAPWLVIGIINALFGFHNESMLFCLFKHHGLA